MFPGGRVDPGDRDLAAGFAGDPDDLTARVAAVRETVEETGLAIGLDSPPGSEAVARLRAALHAGERFGDALAEARCRLRPEALVPFARWRPAHRQARIFDTRFYLAQAEAGEAVVDGTENTRLFWASAAQVLADADAGRLHIIFPTRRNLERLARFGSFAEAATDARAHPIRTVTPWTEVRGGAEHLCIPDDLGYPVTSEPLTGASRG